MKQHKYTHLGMAPYSLVGAFYDPPVQDINGAWHGGMNTCDHCGRPISYVFMCVSSDGKKFNLGSVHVEDLGDSGLTQAVRTKAQQMKKEVLAEARRKKWQEQWEAERPEREAREAKIREEDRVRREKLQQEYERVLPLAEKMPHPNSYFSSKGKTLKDYILYFQNGSRWHDLNDAPYQVKNALRQAGANI